MQQLDGWTKDTSPFHAGEQAMQARAGVREQMESFGRRVIRPDLPDQHRAFYAQLPFLIVGSVDAAGWPWASIVAGEPGFVSSPDARTLDVAAAPVPGDPLGAALAHGAPLGVLGIEPATRRRNRVNARVAAADASGLRLAVDQAFGNCPQYIQTRELSLVRDPRSAPASAGVERLRSLDAAAREAIAGADTFFVSSYVPAGAHEDVEGVDVSHRGGRRGFVKVEGDTLTVPDYSGNLHFNTLGNFVANPKAGLLFPDFESGDLLMLTGTVELLAEDAPEVRAFRGAERAWRFTLVEGLRLPDALALRGSLGEYAPTALATGDWREAEAELAAAAARDRWRTYRVARVREESASIRSFLLAPTDGEPLPPFAAGQYLTVRVTPRGAGKPVVRTYTVSSAPGEAHYRISVKREPAPSAERPPGLVSNHLHDTLAPGDLVEVRGPGGDFTLDAAATRPAILVAGGVGITPMLSMARHVANVGRRSGRTRPLSVLHAARSTRERAFADDFRSIEASTGGAVRYRSFVSAPGEDEAAGVDYDVAGRITDEALAAALAPQGSEIFLCGPPAFMQATYDAARRLGVPDADIRAEAFGPASLSRSPDAGGPASTETAEEAAEALVRFTRSGFEQRWTGTDGTLLDLAEAHGLTPEYGCRSGACGTCAVPVVAGEVVHRGAAAGPRAAGEALVCCAVPARGSETVEIAL